MSLSRHESLVCEVAPAALSNSTGSDRCNMAQMHQHLVKTTIHSTSRKAKDHHRTF